MQERTPFACRAALGGGTRYLVGVALFVVACFIYVVTESLAVREQIGAAATAVARPIVVPAVELINVPAFVYVVSLVILTSGIAACLVV